MAKEHITSAIAAAAKPLSPSNPSPLHSIVPLQPERKYLDQVLEPASINGSAWDSKAGGEGPLPHPDPVVEENAEGANAGGRVSLDTAPVMLSGAAGQQQADSNQIHSNHHNPETPRLPPPDEDDVSGDGRPFVVPRAESIDRPSTPSRPMNEESIGLVASRLAGKLDDAMGLIEFLVNEVKSVRGTVEGIDERLGVLEGSVDSIGSRIRMQRLAATAVTGSGSEAARQQQPVAAANANGEWWADLKGLGDRLSQVGNLRGGLEKSPESRQGKRDSEERSVSVQADGSEDGSSAMGLLSPLEPVTSLSARKTRLAKDW